MVESTSFTSFFSCIAENLASVILKYLAAAAATQFMMDFEMPACGKVGYTLANMGNDIASALSAIELCCI